MRLSYEPRQLRRVTDAREFGHVAVLFGGDSSEREISLLTGNAVLDALKRRGVDAHAFDPRATALSDLIARRFDRVKLPLIVKPATQGSSVGMTKVERAADLPAAYALAVQLETLVFAEAWIPGPEYTVAVLQERALPSIRIETPRTFYDYEAKYFRDDTRYFCPSGLSHSAEEHLANLALAAFEAAGASGWGRVDFMMDTAGRCR